jgi:hypothetical protein
MIKLKMKLNDRNVIKKKTKRKKKSNAVFTEGVQ